MSAGIVVPFPSPERLALGRLPEAVRDYLEHRGRKGASPRTLIAYGDDLRRLVRHCEAMDVHLVAHVSEYAVHRFLDAELARGVSPRSTSRRLAACRAFFRWARLERLAHHDPTERQQLRFRPKRVVAPEMAPLLAMVRAIDTRPAIGLRDRAMLTLILDAGLRASESVAVDVPGAGSQCTADLNRAVVHCPGKGGGVDTVGFGRPTADLLARWLQRRDEIAPEVSSPALFPSVRGDRMCRHSVAARLKLHAAAVGMPRLHLHLLRHRRLGDIAETLGLDAACHQARHSSKATTAAIYGAHAEAVLREHIRQRAGLEVAG